MSKRNTNQTATIGVDTYRDNKLYPRVALAVGELLANGKIVASVNVLITMGLLDPKRLEDWRRGRVRDRSIS